MSRGGITLDGPLWRKHTSLSLNVDLFSSSDAQTYLATTPDGPISGSATRPLDRSGVTLEVEHALTKTHTARLELTRNHTATDRLGVVGGTNLPERAYQSSQTTTSLRLSDSGPIGKALFNEFRLQNLWGDQHADSATAAPAIIVLDAFNAGGAQVNNRRRSWDVEAADNLDVARGRHAMRVGALVQAGRYEASDESNTLGTFTFSSLAQYVAGRPATFTKRTGNPLVSYSFVRAGWYFQDDIKLHKTLSAQRRTATRSAESRGGPLQSLAASRWHLGATAKCQAHNPRRRGVDLQLVRIDRLRTDASRRRRPPVRSGGRQSWLSGSLHRRAANCAAAKPPAGSKQPFDASHPARHRLDADDVAESVDSDVDQ